MDDLYEDQSNSESVDYAELLHKVVYRGKVLMKRYWWIVPSAIALGITYKAIDGYLQEPVYKSSSQMIVSGRIDLPENEVYAEERDNFFGTQIALMNSGEVKSRAIERVQLMNPEAHEALLKTESYIKDGFKSLVLEAKLRKDTNIFDMNVIAPQPEYTRVYLDAVMEEYINRRSEMRSKTSERTYDAIVKQVEELEKEVDRGEDSIVAFQELNNVVFIQEQGSAAGEHLAELKRTHAELMTESRLLASIVSPESVDGLLLQSGESAAGSVLATVGSEEDNQKYLQSKELLDQYQAELEEFSIYLKPQHPKIINLKDQIERTENQLEILRRQALVHIQDRKRVVESKLINLNQEIVIWEQTALKNGRLIAEFERLQSRLDRSKAALVQSQETLRMIEGNQNLNQEMVSVFVPAGHARPAGTGIVRQFIEGFLYGIILAGGILFIIASMDNRILTASELSAQFREPLIGAIPFEKCAKGSEDTVLLLKNDQRYVFAEACRNMRTSVFFLGDENFKPSVFAVTSAVPAEGKSTVSANLAVALSFSRSNVLLIDADLRRGRLHKLFGLRRDDGLVDVLEGDMTLDQAVQKTDYEHLDFLSIGLYPDHPAELLMSDKINALIEEARSKYDFVIFDTAPILATDDTTTFAGKVDAVLFTIRSAYTQVRQIKPAMNRLKERNIPVTGLILNYLDTKQPGYYYYRYSEYYTDRKHAHDASPSVTSA